VNPEAIGMSFLRALTVVLVLAALWPFLPSTGPFSQIPTTIDTISEFVIPAVVIGAPAVAYYLLRGW